MPERDVIVSWWKITYSLLSELAGALVLAVAQQLDNAALIGSQTARIHWLASYRPFRSRCSTSDPIKVRRFVLMASC